MWKYENGVRTPTVALGSQIGWTELSEWELIWHLDDLMITHAPENAEPYDAKVIALSETKYEAVLNNGLSVPIDELSLKGIKVDAETFEKAKEIAEGVFAQAIEKIADVHIYLALQQWWTSYNTDDTIN